MKLAVQQPYLFAYSGYFQLINRADTFIFYDDVDFIKGGYINRNKLCTKSGEKRFTVPLRKMSSNKLITETEIHQSLYSSWKKKFLKTIELSFSKAEYYGPIREILDNVLEDPPSTISELAISSTLEVCNYLRIQTTFKKSSEMSYDRSKPAKDKIVQLCHQEGATTYLNLPGGKELYERKEFDHHDIKLRFIEPNKISYPCGDSLQSGHSILNVLFNHSPETIKEKLEL